MFYGVNQVVREFYLILFDQVKQVVVNCVKGEGEDFEKDFINVLGKEFL